MNRVALNAEKAASMLDRGSLPIFGSTDPKNADQALPDILQAKRIGAGRWPCNAAGPIYAFTTR
jgi:hypothetical protein